MTSRNVPSYLTGHPLYKEHKRTSDGSIICNPRFRVIISDWDRRCQDRIATGLDFRITEKGKTDVDLDPGFYSIHSPLYGTDWNDSNAFEDRWSCPCGYLQGRRHMDKDTVCPKCGKKVLFVDTDLKTTGWFILDRNHIIHPAMYLKMKKFFGEDHFHQMINFVEEEKRGEFMTNKSSPWYGIGMIEFYERFDEILDWYYSKNKKHEQYDFFKIFRETIFVHSIPCYSSTLRKWMVRNDTVRYSKEDRIINKLFSDHKILNDDFEWQRRKDGRAKRGKDPNYHRKENILYRIQKYTNQLYETSFVNVNKKAGIINEDILGVRLNFTARNVIVPAPYLRVDELSLGYTTFLELFKFELVALMKELYGISDKVAWNKWEAASAVYSEQMYQLMTHLMKHNDMYISIDRPPSINHGSYITMRVAEINKDPTDYCMGLPPYVLQKANGDFDGDNLSIFCHKLNSVSREFYKRSNPRSNLCIDHNNGLYDVDSSLFKDGIVGLYAFLNI